ncbi:MAG: YncE family protein, partial [Woeseiaceae bacterium]
MRHENKVGQVNRREFIATISGGVAMAALGEYASAADPSTRKRHLFVTNNPNRTVDVFDIEAGHKLLRSFPMGGKKVGGACADAASGRLFITQQDENTVTAYDLQSGEVVWSVNTDETHDMRQPDRLCVTTDGTALYVPMKKSHKTLILDTGTGERIADFDRPGRPHNSWSGESGKYMYVAGRSHDTMYLADPRTHKVVRQIGQFRWPVRPFSVDAEERFIYANLTYLIGFAVADIESGAIHEVLHMPPKERTRYWDEAKAGLPHGDHPYSHGIAVRPGANEVWYLDDQWG